MAEEYKKSHSYANPPLYDGKGSGLRSIRRNTTDDGTVSGSNPAVPLHDLSRTGLVKHSFNEVGSGLRRDAYGNNQSGTVVSEFPIKSGSPDGGRWLMSHGQREPLWQRTNYPIMNMEDGGISSNKFFYSQYNKTNGNRSVIPQFDRWLKPEHGYDEQYFQHIFNWPLDHTLIERKIGGFIRESGSDNAQAPATPTTTTTLHALDWEFGTSSDNAELELDKVDSEIGYTTVDNNGDWVFNKITTNADGTFPESAQKKIGAPIIYHGGTETQALFFNYIVTPPSPTPNLISNGTFTGNTAGWTTASGGTITDASNQCRFTQPSDSIWMQMSQNITTEIGKTYEVTFTLGTSTSTNPNWRIYIDKIGADPYGSTHKQHIWGYQNNGSGITGSRQNPNRTYKGKFIATATTTTFYVENGASGGVVSHIDTIEVREVRTSTSGTTNVVAPGDVVVGDGGSCSITKVVNYIVDTTLKRTVASNSAKNTLPATLRINSVDGVSIGDTVIGKGLRTGTTITAINHNTKTLTLSLSLNQKKVKSIRILSGAGNEINVNTLCYMALANPTGIDFDADNDYWVQRGGVNQFQIKARAGWNVKHRSAICGVYYTENKKELEYTPVFYSADPHCTKSVTEDINGKWTLGSITWDDGSQLNGKLLLTNAKTDIGYKIASIYMTFTRAPIDKDTFEVFLEEYNKNSNLIILYGTVKAYVTANLGGKKAISVTDDICRDEITLDYSQFYDAFQEADNISTVLSDSAAAIQDVCLDRDENDPPTLADAQKRFKEILQNSVGSSSFLPKEYYEKLVSNEDSLFNKIGTAGEAVKSTSARIKNIDKIPSVIEGEDSSGRIWRSSTYRGLPPAMDRVKYLINDMQIGVDEDLDIVLDLNPETTVNQPRLVIRSLPRWTWQGNKNTSTVIVDKSNTIGGGAKGHIKITIEKDSNGYVDDIHTGRSTTQFTKQNCTLDPGIEGPTSAPVSPNTKVYTWQLAKVDTGTDNRYFGDRPSSTASLKYLNLALPPEERDLQYDHFNQDLYPSEYSDPDEYILPKELWKPNINYQTDYYKMFEYRIEEATRALAETIVNDGNPYIDNPSRAKLTKDLGTADTTIEVASTAGFLSSGYLMIPKYIKKVYTQETGNTEPYFTYCGEEIIFYKSKTATSFTECERARFGTSTLFGNTISATEIEPGVRYKIKTLGFTDWSLLEVPNPQVGRIFTANKDAVIQQYILGSCYLDGDSDWFDFDKHPDFALGTSDFTIECWIKTNESTVDGQSERIVYMTDGPTGNNANNLVLGLGSGPKEGLFRAVVSPTEVVASTTRVDDDEWHHIAVTRASGTTRIFVDGILEDSGTHVYTITANSGSPRPRIGSWDGTQGDFKGHISNFRIVKSALYTAAFTPSTVPLEIVSDTILLCCKNSIDVTDFDTSLVQITNNNVGGGVRNGINHNPFFPDITTIDVHGTVEVFGSTEDETPDAPLIKGIEATPKIPVLSSYNKGFSVAQFPIFQIQE